MIGLSFLKMAAAFFRDRQQQSRDLGLPLLGVNYGEETNIFLSQETLFTPQVAYTCGIYSISHSGNILGYSNLS